MSKLQEIMIELDTTRFFSVQHLLQGVVTLEDACQVAESLKVDPGTKEGREVVLEILWRDWNFNDSVCQ